MKDKRKLMRGFLIFTVTLLAAWGAIDIFTSAKNTGKPDENQPKQNSNNTFASFAYELPKEMTFAGEQIPLQNYDVRESLDQELLKVAYWHSEMFSYLKKSYRFFPIVEPILKANGIPEDFKYLMVTESGMRNVTSPAGAKGFWQFMEETATSYGMTVNKEIDERYDLEKATVGACKYLKEAYNRYGSWTLAAASYNVGQGNLNKQIRGQGTDDYYDMFLNVETARYIYRIAAVKLVMQNPQSYGYYFRKTDLYPIIDTKTISTDTVLIDLTKFAKQNGTNYKVFKLLNPWLRADIITNSAKKTYKFVVPTEKGRSKDYFAGETDDEYLENAEVYKQK